MRSHPDNSLPTPITLQVSPASCAETSWEEAPDARVPGCAFSLALRVEIVLLTPPRVDVACLDVPPDGRHRTPSPSIACIDPRLTVLWPSPPASLSEEESSLSVDDGWTAFDDWDQESPGARVPGTYLSYCALPQQLAHSRGASECVLEESTTQTLNAEGGPNELNAGPGESSPIGEREVRKTRSTVSR